MFLLILMVVQNYISLTHLSDLHRIVGSIFSDLDALKRDMEGEEVEVEKGTIVIKSDVLFSFNRWEIRDARALGNLRRIGEKLKTYLDNDRRQKFRIVIEGHTDTMGPSENNDRLSYQRAQSLALLWRRKIGFTPEHYELIPAGLGESNPKIEVRRDTITIYSDVFSPSGMWDGDGILPAAKEDLESIGKKLRDALDARRRDGKFAITIKARTDTQRVSELSDARRDSLEMLWRNIGLTHEYYELISRGREEDGSLATRGTRATEGTEGTRATRATRATEGTEGTKEGIGSFRVAAIDSNLRKAVENANRRVEVKIIPKFSELEPFYRSKKKPTDS